MFKQNLLQILAIYAVLRQTNACIGGFVPINDCHDSNCNTVQEVSSSSYLAPQPYGNPYGFGYYGNEQPNVTSSENSAIPIESQVRYNEYPVYSHNSYIPSTYVYDVPPHPVNITPAHYNIAPVFMPQLSYPQSLFIPPPPPPPLPPPLPVNIALVQYPQAPQVPVFNFTLPTIPPPFFNITPIQIPVQQPQYSVPAFVPQPAYNYNYSPLFSFPAAVPPPAAPSSAASPSSNTLNDAPANVRSQTQGQPSSAIPVFDFNKLFPAQASPIQTPPSPPTTASPLTPPTFPTLPPLLKFQLPTLPTSAPLNYAVGITEDPIQQQSTTVPTETSTNEEETTTEDESIDETTDADNADENVPSISEKYNNGESVPPPPPPPSRWSSNAQPISNGFTFFHPPSKSVSSQAIRVSDNYVPASSTSVEKANEIESKDIEAEIASTLNDSTNDTINESNNSNDNENDDASVEPTSASKTQQTTEQPTTPDAIAVGANDNNVESNENSANNSTISEAIFQEGITLAKNEENNVKPEIAVFDQYGGYH